MALLLAPQIVFLAPHILGPSKWHLKSTTTEEGPGRRKKGERARGREIEDRRGDAQRTPPIVCFAAVAASDFDASSHVPFCSFSGTVCADIIGLSSAP